ncbi:MAG: hypothetical protein FWC89_13625 [Defluviitaleaceae bacterium]|nr:hypothetical protein [Defluviitaleaceae bacterium]
MVYVSVILLALSVTLIVAVLMNGRSHRRKQEEMNRRFLEEEEAANAVRKKDIDADLYYTANLSALPQLPNPDPHQVERCANRTMIRFAEPISNLELKKQYGLAQMDVIAQYEENFTEYLKSLTKWAMDIAENQQEDALKIVEEVVTLGGEFRDTYRLAADIYVAKNDHDGLNTLLINATENHFKDPAIRRQVLDYISLKKEEISA